ncbi:apoptosis antagonizing transcription factor-domain-containing protein [Pilobolus umbonatus]|nr:apoptosis antagonizing transcription factor-domain-containing protein [Pilobolus umbonatus]
MSKSNVLTNLLNDLESTAPLDYDPEDISEPFNDNNNDSEEEEEDNSAARDHYASVGKSKLRHDQPLLDDPKYSGKRTSRKELYSESESEEEWKGISPTESQNEESDDFDDEEDLVKKSVNYVSDENVSSSEEEEEEDSEKEEKADEEEDSEKDEVDVELRKIQAEEKQMISQLSKSAQTDIEKGQQVRQQLTLWDNCLENRIRMQKVVDNANKLPQKEQWGTFLSKAEATNDLDTCKDELREVIDDLMDIRTSLLEQNGAVDISKHDFNSRKRCLDDDDEYIDKLWKDISSMNDIFTPYRNNTLEKWSNKVQVAAGARLNKKFKAFDQNIMSQIETIMSDKHELVKRTRLQRTDYTILGKETKENDQPQQEEVDNGKRADRHLSNYDPEIFDDQDFYQQQLRELIESRMVDTDDPIAIGMRWAARKQNEQKKKKKVVDRKSSKGRKLRFNVHEKLQNFMIPIPVGEWHESMIDELYTSLLGQRLKDNLLE